MREIEVIINEKVSKNVHKEIHKLIKDKENLLRLFKDLRYNTVIVTSLVKFDKSYHIVNANERIIPKSNENLKKSVHDILEKWTSYNILIKEKRGRFNIYFPTPLGYALKNPSIFPFTLNYEDVAFFILSSRSIENLFEIMAYFPDLPKKEIEKLGNLHMQIHRNLNPLSRNKLFLNPNHSNVKLLDAYLTGGKIMKELIETCPEECKRRHPIYQKIIDQSYFINPREISMSYLDYMYYELIKKKYDSSSNR